MNVSSLAELLLSPEEKEELQNAVHIIKKYDPPRDLNFAAA